MRRIFVGVMGPGEGARARDRRNAFTLGGFIARRGWVLLTGGRNEGVMDAASRGTKEAGGLTVGILPSSDKREASKWVDIPIVTGIGSARNNINILSSDIVIACGAVTAGTLSEIALAIKSRKKVIILGCGAADFRFLKKVGGEFVSQAATPSAAVRLAEKFLRKPRL